MPKSTSKQGVQGTARELSGHIFNTGGLADNEITIIPSSVSLEEKVGMRIHKIEYYLTSPVAVAANAPLLPMGASGDQLKFGLAFLAAMPVGGFFVESPGVIDFNVVTRLDLTAVGSINAIDPMIIKDKAKDYPPDGILVHPANIYHWSYCTNALAAAISIGFKVFYTMEELSQDVWDSLWKQMFVTQAG